MAYSWKVSRRFITVAETALFARQAQDIWDEAEHEAFVGMEMGKFADELIESMSQAATHASGRKVRGMRVTRVEIPDVKAIRRSLRMSQHRFAAAYRIPLPTLKNWEQGRRRPRRRICSPSSAGPRRSWKPSRVECGVTTDRQSVPLTLADSGAGGQRLARRLGYLLTDPRGLDILSCFRALLKVGAPGPVPRWAIK
jgi:putative transcriptional regulator